MTTAAAIQARRITIGTGQPGATVTAGATSPGLAIDTARGLAAITIGAPDTTGTGVAAGPTGRTVSAVDTGRSPVGTSTTSSTLTTRATITAQSTTTMNTGDRTGTAKATITAGTTVTAVLPAGTRGIPVSTGVTVAAGRADTTIAAHTISSPIDTVGF
ncbi:hypothetical protein AWC24_00395 [Mycolicibacter senuensis]|uniref:Uncharacterized protein n=1 Tax=Mycolicibacter senuensis TaxID=386913 RepID=A0A7I9XQI2_9MYCO|nr:hypothetical protein AWC24_00395 [Mycolicibacter senuensis]GFG72261.1 hypothetical protein MSEN_39810 [Mycolicibacter senuensis]